MFRKIEDVIRSKPATAESERADWTGETKQAQFQGARAEDSRRVSFGKRKG